MKPGSRLDLAATALLFLGGLAAVGFGLWQIYPPAAWLWGGGAALVVSLGGRPAARSEVTP